MFIVLFAYRCKEIIICFELFSGYYDLCPLGINLSILFLLAKLPSKKKQNTIKYR